jgi:predicted nuclease of predicted toxin-antitoxin system
MNSTLSFFADENISPDLIKWIRENGFIISGVKEENMCGATDISIIQKCFISNEIILTHDNDFGKIIFTNTISFYSIIYLRPGHFDAGFHIPTLKSILKKKELIRKGTLIIGHRTVDKIKIRIKQIEIKLQ